MELGILLDNAGIEYRAEGKTNIDITDIVSDSRRVCRGCLFLCIRGIKSDSHLYADRVCADGAVALVIEVGCVFDRRRIPAEITIIYTQNTRAALARLWYARYELAAAKFRFVAVTGTNGKTTVSHMLRTIFGAAMYRCGIIGTVGCETPLRVLDTRCDPNFSPDDANANMTTPDPGQLYRILAAMRDDGVEYVFMEATSHALALSKLAPLHFTAAVITNLTPEHLDFHGNMENYFLAKAEILKMTDIAVLNADDAYADRFLEYARERELPCAEHIILCSAGHNRVKNTVGCIRYTAESIRVSDGGGISYTMVSPGEIRALRCAMPGGFTVMNSLQAAAAAISLGIGGNAVSDALASASPTPGRLERVRISGKFPISVFIDYAHTPDALENLLRTARGFIDARSTCRGEPRGRVILLFGCGGDRDRQKRPEMGRIASKMADFCVITSDNSRSERPCDIIDDIMSGFDLSCPHITEVNRKAAIEWTIKNAGSGDVILLAGKGHEKYEIDANGRHEFCEADIVKNAAVEWMRVHGETEDGNL